MPNNGTVLVAEDERTARAALAELLEEHNYRVIAAEDGHSAFLSLMKTKVDAALLDIRMPGVDGLTILRRVREAGLDTPVIVMTAFGDSDTVIQAMRLGAYDYVPKPVDFEQLLGRLERAVSHYQLSKRAGRDEVAQDVETAILVGRSPSMQHVYKLIGQVAASNATVIVRGESGTGKELAVNAIHHNSTRAKGPLDQSELRGDSRNFTRIGTLRAREGSLHQRLVPPCGPV